MSDIVVDSCAVAKWVVEEPGSNQAEELLKRALTGDRLVVVDLVFSEVTKGLGDCHEI
ncbi:MAG: hypothetical protein FWD61_05790 [Phycisphaerales bacterium]|nr:hypothetical protein [Phycisphaerales bacterium]